METSRVSNGMMITNEFDVLCLNETWLTASFQTAAFSTLTKYTDVIAISSNKKKHGSVLIEIPKGIDHKIVHLGQKPIGSLRTTGKIADGHLVVCLNSLLICCIYNPPKNSPYTVSSEDLKYIFRILKEDLELNCNGTIST